MASLMAAESSYNANANALSYAPSEPIHSAGIGKQPSKCKQRALITFCRRHVNTYVIFVPASQQTCAHTEDPLFAP